MTQKKSATTTLDNSSAQLIAELPQTEFDAVLNSIPDIIIRFSLSGEVVWWNKNFDDVISLSKEQLLRLSLTEIFVSCSSVSIEKIQSETIDKGDAEIDAFLVTSENKNRYHLKCTLITSTGDKELLVVGRDINERAKMEDALQQSQTQLQNLVDGLPFLVFLYSVDDRFILANKKFCDFLRLSQAEIIGYKFDDILNENINTFLLRDNDKTLTEKCLVHYEGMLEIDRNNIQLSVDKFPLFDDNNKIYALCGVVEDVTSQYQLQRQLQQTQKMEAIGQLSGGIAHDFNNVLASIMGYTGLAKRVVETNNDEVISGYLNQIMRGGERARDLVQQLLAFSRGDVASLEILEPDSLAKESVEMLSSLIPSSIKLNLKIKKNNLKTYIEVDPVQFNQGLMNLIINAKDAIVDEVGTIDVSLEYLTHAKGVCDSCHTTFSGKYVQLSVTDSGIGINKEILGRIFDPFFTTKDVGKGSGMGLSMLHGIVHGSGGHIVIKSNKLNNGTTIQVYFPEVKPKSVIENTAEYLVENVTNKSKGQSILIIDDEPMITSYLTDLLENEGYQVTSFNNSLPALEYFKDNAKIIDIIITDQTMPELTGLELAKTIHQLNYTTPIILCTGYTDLMNESANLDSGIAVCVNKPFDDNSLLRNISKLLSIQ